MSLVFDSSPIVASSVVFTQYSGFGVLAENVPLTGDNGGSILANDISLPADAGKELRYQIVSMPSGTLEYFEDGSFIYTGTSSYFTYQLYVNGVATGSSTVVLLQVGATPPVVSAYPDPSDVRLGVVYGEGGTLVGTMVSTGGDPSSGQVIGVLIGRGIGLTLDGRLVIGTA